MTEFLVGQTFNGISYAALLFLLGGGLTLILGVMKVVNIAHGSFYLVGGYIGYVIVRYTGNFYLALCGACVGIAFFGMTMERFVLRGLEGQNLRQMLMTMGVALFFQDLLLLIFEGYPLNLKPPAFCMLQLQVGKYSFHVLRLFMIGAAAIIYIILWWFQEKTRAGAILRAAVDNKEIAQGMGINVPLVTMGVFGLGGLLAAIGGVVGCAFTAIYPGLDFELLPLAFVIVIVGGMGSLKGALVGAIIVGLVDNFGRAIFPELSYFTLFAPMVLILALRPIGLFGKE
jgi:branched-chain amino acid transport system permease protein